MSAMAVYKVKLIGPDGEENEFDAPDDAYILDSAENTGLELPYLCFKIGGSIRWIVSG